MLSAYTQSHNTMLTAGWYLAPHGISYPFNFPLQKIDFPRYFGTSQPTEGGLGHPCTPSSSVICAAYFDINSVNVNDPNNGHLRYVTGTAL